MAHMSCQRKPRSLRALSAVTAAALAALLPGLVLAATPQWDLTVVAQHRPGGATTTGPSSIFGAPAIDRFPGTGAWQVAFATSLPGGAWADNSPLLPGVHLQELGGAHRTIVKDGDPLPDEAGLTFCFYRDVCGPPAGNVSLSNGEVAFAAQAREGPNANALKAVFLMNGPTGPRRVADSRTHMPGYPVATFDSFSSPSLSEGNVVFQATGGTPAMMGVYGDLGAGLAVIADLNGGTADITRFRDLGPFPSVSRVYFSDKAFLVALEGSGDSRSAPSQPLDGIFEHLFDAGVFKSSSTVAISKLADQSYFSPAIDFGGGIAAVSNAPAVYGGNPLETVADRTTIVPSETAPFRDLLTHPATDISPHQVGQSVRDRWTAFVGNSPTTDQGVYLQHVANDTLPPTTTLEKVTDSPTLWRALAPWVGASPSDTPPPIGIHLFHQGVRDGVVAFGVTLEGSSTSADFIVVATKTTPTLTLKADADTYVRADLVVRQNDNYGMQDFVEVGTGRADGSQVVGAADRMRALLHFNTSVLPRLRLNSATLETTLHSFDNGTASSVYTIDAHRVTTAWATPGGEGNGFEGSRPPGAPASLTDPDAAFGVAWLGAPANPDPFAANNSTQPGVDPTVLATQVIHQQTNVRGDKLQWDITPLARGWLDGTSGNNGVALTDALGDVVFRGLRMGSREGEAYGLPLAVSGPRLALKWTLGVMPGDLTGDGCVDRDDLTVMMAVLRGQAEPGSALSAKLDVNGDGKVDIADARKLATLFTRPLGVPCTP